MTDNLEISIKGGQGQALVIEQPLMMDVDVIFGWKIQIFYGLLYHRNMENS